MFVILSLFIVSHLSFWRGMVSLKIEFSFEKAALSTSMLRLPLSSKILPCSFVKLSPIYHSVNVISMFFHVISRGLVVR